MIRSNPNTPGLDCDVPPMDRDAPTGTARTALALGCFWGPDAQFGALDGVVRTCVGYAGGTTENPTYADIGDHIETVQIEYDPAQISYAELLEVFWSAHDPRRAPFKRQYQPALFPSTDEQVDRARESKEQAALRNDGEITTELIVAPTFYRAEAYHQKHSLRQHTPLMKAFRQFYPEEDAFTDSPAAALVNGYVGGHRSPARLDDDLPRLGLPSDAVDALRAVAERRHS